MTQETQIPSLSKLLQIADSDPRSYLLAAALPEVIAAGIHAWKYGEAKEWDYEKRVAFTIDQSAGALLGVIESNGLHK